MDFIDQIKAISNRIPKQVDVIQTEEATKNAFIMPFIAALGYNVFDPTEVVPEFTADVGTKKGEKVDYAIMIDGMPAMLFECKHHAANLDQAHASQLHRYFHVTTARIGVLTNGIVYRFYSDLDEPNKMDTKPFLELNMLDLKEMAVEESKRFSKGSFQLEQIISAAQELKYLREVKRLLNEEFYNPSEDFVKFFASRVYTGKVTQKILTQFGDFTKKALHQFLNDKINERLKSALSVEISTAPQEAQTTAKADSIPSSVEAEQKAVVTTEEEIEAFHIIKAMLRDVVEPKRIAFRDNQNYAAILLDDNNRKTICRLYFNRANKYVGLFDTEKNEQKILIANINELYDFAERMKTTIALLDRSAVGPKLG